MTAEPDDDARWRKAAAALPGFTFGDDPDVVNELGALAASGVKTATCGLKSEYDAAGGPPVAGDRAVVLDSRKRPWCVIEFTEVTVKRFGEIDARFAHDEGEGDRSHALWRKVHVDYFSPRDPEFSDETWIVCERFRLLYVFGDAGAA
ncbi:MAG: ASCH domain-containing protein [Pseudomonadota bacterium]